MNNISPTNQSPHKQTFVFIGASSVITKAIAEIYAKQGHHIIFAGRANPDNELTLNHLKIIGASHAEFIPLDITSFATHQEFVDLILSHHKEYQSNILNIIVLTAMMPNQDDINQSVSLGIETIQVSYTGIFSLIHRFVPYFEQHKMGSITLFGSVAGDRGRLKNYVYGSAKAALECYASGLRNQLGRSDVHVLLVKPGFMNTPMIKGMQLPPLPIAEPEQVAQAVIGALEKKRNVIYVPFFWKVIMEIIKHIPEFIFKKLSF